MLCRFNVVNAGIIRGNGCELTEEKPLEKLEFKSSKWRNEEWVCPGKFSSLFLLVSLGLLRNSSPTEILQKYFRQLKWKSVHARSGCFQRFRYVKSWSFGVAADYCPTMDESEAEAGGGWGGDRAQGFLAAGQGDHSTAEPGAALGVSPAPCGHIRINYCFYKLLRDHWTRSFLFGVFTLSPMGDSLFISCTTTQHGH